MGCCCEKQNTVANLPRYESRTIEPIIVQDLNSQSGNLGNSNNDPKPSEEENIVPPPIVDEVKDECNENKPEEEIKDPGFSNNDENQDLSPKNTTCCNEHQYKWKQDLVYFYMKTNGLEQQPIIMACAECNSMFSKASWQCTVCYSVICNNCGVNKNLMRPIIKCTRGHEPKWSVDSWAYPLEKKKTTRPLIICSVCKKSLQEPAYTCRPCYYNSCINCSKGKGVVPPIDILVCDSDNEPLVLTSITDQQCSQCNKPIKDTGYACSSCNIYKCKSCVIIASLKMIRHAGLRCRENHPSMCLNDCKRSGNKDKQSCINCGTSVLNYGLFCVCCADRCCLDCAEKIQDLIEACIGKKLDETNYINWYNYIDIENDQILKCGTCKENISDGIYFVDKLNQSHCTDCISSKN